MALNSENADGFGEKGYYDGFSGDAERQGAAPGYRKMSRIDKPVTKSIAGVTSDDDATDTSVSVGKQMELESGNAIKYRTCSWQKV